MPTIKEENQKPLRKALQVHVGIDINSEDVEPNYRFRAVDEDGNRIASTFRYDSRIHKPIPRTPLMDFYSPDGFVNDGLAEPKSIWEGTKNGVYFTDKPIGGNADGKIVDASTGTIVTVVIELYEARQFTVFADGKVHTGYGSITIDEWTPNKRVVIDRIVYGDCRMWSNDSLISCSLNLRSVETKAQEPSLQMSEIKVEVYEPNDLTNFIGRIPENTPIWYMAGYPGDMSEVRRFYISEAVQQEGHVLSFSGYDATKFLEDDYSVYIGESGGLHNYVTAIDVLLTKAGINHKLVDTWNDEAHTQGAGQFLWDKRSKRVMIATLVNHLRTAITTDGDTEVAPGYEVPAYLMYVDAGIPTLTTKRDTENVYEINDTTLFQDEIERESRYQLYGFGKIIESTVWEDVESIELESGSSVIKSVSEPYIQLRASNGVLTQLDPFTYTISGIGTSNITGRRLYPQDTYWNYEGLDWLNTELLTAGDMYWNASAQMDSGSKFSVKIDVVSKLAYRSNKLHTFTWRGDPHLQPRDYIRVNGKDMTIDTITLDHVDGGLTSTITAREGFI